MTVRTGVTRRQVLAGLTAAALGRIGVDLMLVFFSPLYVLWKQKRAHRREPLV